MKKEYAKLPVEILHIANYQKQIKQNTINNIIKNYHPESIGNLLVSYRDGKYWVYDGQHRLIALKKLGVHLVNCEISYGMTYADEAQAFEDFNRHISRANAMDEANAAYERGDVKVTEVAKAVEDAGLLIDFKNQGRDYYIGSYKSLERIFDKYGAHYLTKILKIVVRVWGGKRNSLAGASIEGLAEFIQKTRFSSLYNENSFIQRLNKTPYQEAQIINKKKHQFGLTGKEAWIATFVEIYNSHRTFRNQIQIMG